MSFVINSITILNILGVNYRCITLEISKSDVINLLKNADLNERYGLLSDMKKLTFSFFI